MTLEQRLTRLERTVRRQRLGLIALGLGAGSAMLVAATSSRPGTIEARAIRIVDATGKPRILLGAPTPAEGRERQDGQTASLVVLGPDGRDRVILGEAPNPRLEGRTFPRVAAAYGLTIHNAQGSERGGMNYLDNGRGVIALDRPGGDAVALIVNEQSGFAGLTVNYAAPLGQHKEAVRIGSRGDTAWVAMQDREEAERARLAIEGTAAPALQVRAAGAAPAK